eukprot:SAG31_NODE_3910_length_3762_cov_2.592684_3_plen_661_part_01
MQLSIPHFKIPEAVRYFYWTGAHDSGCSRNSLSDRCGAWATAGKLSHECASTNLPAQDSHHTAKTKNAITYHLMAPAGCSTVLQLALIRFLLLLAMMVRQADGQQCSSDPAASNYDPGGTGRCTYTCASFLSAGSSAAAPESGNIFRSPFAACLLQTGGPDAAGAAQTLSVSLSDGAGGWVDGTGEKQRIAGGGSGLPVETDGPDGVRSWAAAWTGPLEFPLFLDANDCTPEADCGDTDIRDRCPIKCLGTKAIIHGGQLAGGSHLEDSDGPFRYPNLVGPALSSSWAAATADFVSSIRLWGSGAGGCTRGANDLDPPLTHLCDQPSGSFRSDVTIRQFRVGPAAPINTQIWDWVDWDRAGLTYDALWYPTRGADYIDYSGQGYGCGETGGTKATVVVIRSDLTVHQTLFEYNQRAIFAAEYSTVSARNSVFRHNGPASRGCRAGKCWGSAIVGCDAAMTVYQTVFVDNQVTFGVGEQPGGVPEGAHVMLTWKRLGLPYVVTSMSDNTITPFPAPEGWSMQAKIEESTFELPTPPNETDSGIMLSQRLFLDAADFSSTFIAETAQCDDMDLSISGYCTQKTFQLLDAPGHSDCSAGPKNTRLSVLSFDHISAGSGGPMNEVLSHELVAGTSDPQITSCTEHEAADEYSSTCMEEREAAFAD